MPRKAKTTEETKVKTDTIKTTQEKKAPSNKSTTSRKTTKAVVEKKATKPKTTTKNTETNKQSKTTKKTASTTKATPKTKTTKSTKKSTSKTTKVAKKTKEQIQVMEYYDLPYRYNQTIVKILAQTPKILFVYWDISDKDKDKYKQYYGEDFFSTSRPVLIIHNETMNYSFELEINDFANSWYIHVNDADCKYTVELGRRPNHYITTLKENYVYISSSNHLDAPNDHILFENASPNIKYKNVKNNQINIKDFSNSEFIKQIMKTYSIKTIEELYEKLYSEDILQDLKNGYYNNPTSNTSSTFK